MKPAVIVSGGCQGIGLAVCRRVLPEWDVIILDIQESAETTAALEAESGGRVAGFVADISDRNAVSGVFGRLAPEFSQSIKGLVNCAGIYSEAATGEGTDEEELRIFRVNVLGAQHLVDAAVPRLAKTGGGSIVTLTSMAGRAGGDSAAEAYTGSKSDLIGRGKQWAKAYGRLGIRSNLVAPGPVSTGMIRSWTAARRQTFIEKTPLGRMAEPEDIADAVWFLLSDHSRHITGVCLDVNGGYYIAP